ncbi:unnamed protein product [Ambrosiozyma monospora]|uniref:Unnamed protein product n=1 Tax=Ambrosiozyma monospora TaxID=43982 RepID=A0ACB5TAI2_AMBMO|nr:unnamed protein product [Ambrosiozyma monospora]
MLSLYLVFATMFAQTHAAADYLNPQDAVSLFMEGMFTDFAYWERTADPSDASIFSSFTKKWGSSVEPVASNFIENYDGEQDTAAIQNLYQDAQSVFDTPQFTSDFNDMLSNLGVTQVDYYGYDTNTNYYSYDFSDFAGTATSTGNARSTRAAQSSDSDDSDSHYPSTSRGSRVTSSSSSDDDTDETSSRNNANPRTTADNGSNDESSSSSDGDRPLRTSTSTGFANPLSPASIGGVALVGSFLALLF